ncbi:hypothetical protein DCC62_26100, partial [candidate division KSB1 bacterium]
MLMWISECGLKTSIQHPQSQIPNGEAMLGNYLRIALRNLLKHKGYSFINLFGLALGLSCCILLANLILHELSYDKFHEKAERIHRVVLTLKGETGYATPAPALEQQIPEIEKAVRFLSTQTVVQYEEKMFVES